MLHDPCCRGCDNRSRWSISRARAAPATRRLLWIVIALWLLLYGSFTLLRPPLLDDADSVHAEVAREMVARHDWTTLYANGIRYLEKAPLLYWSMAASFRGFGAHTWSARLPLALYTLLLLLAVFALGQRCFDDVWAGFNASLVLLTSFGLFIFTRILIPDAMVCLWLTLAMLCFWRSLARPTRANAAGFAVACALGVLTKGLIGLVFPLLIVLVYLAMTRNLAASAALASAAGCADFFRDCRAVACGGGFGESYRGAPGCAAHAGQCAWVVLVLLRQRAPAAVSEPASPARLRHRAARALLGAAAWCGCCRGARSCPPRCAACRCAAGGAVHRCMERNRRGCCSSYGRRCRWSSSASPPGRSTTCCRRCRRSRCSSAAGWQRTHARPCRRACGWRGSCSSSALAVRRLRCSSHCTRLLRRAIWRRRSARIPATTRSPSDTSST